MPLNVGYVQRVLVALVSTLAVADAALGQLVPRLGGDFEKLWTVESEPSWLEGPAYDGVGAVWFTNLNARSILRHDIATGVTDLMATDPGTPNGLGFDPEGRLLAAIWKGGRLTRRPVTDLTDVEVLADDWQGTPLVAPNDIAVAVDGGIYFTDQDGQGVYYLNADGVLTLAAAQSGTNGIELSPNGGTLYVVAERITTILRFDVSDDGTLANRQVFAAPGRFLDGLAVDRFGNLYAPTAVSLTAGHEVRVWNSAGQQVLAFEPPELAINATFAPGDMLYLTTRTSLYRVPIEFSLPGDFNSDGTVDAADYVVWRNGLGTSYSQADYDTWRARFSESVDPTVSTSAAVPEPTAGQLIMPTVLLALLRRGQKS
jgi:gluconolactonase